MKKPSFVYLTKEGFFNDIRSCRNGWCIFDMISHFRAMIYDCGTWGNGYYIMLAQQAYHTASVYHIAIAIQLVREGTSVGTNIHEAQYAQSKKDF